MSSRLLIVPAAGLGTRLGGDRPKLLVPVGGMPMIDRLLALFAGAVDRAVVVVHPSFEREVREHLARAGRAGDDGRAATPTGMLDAIMLAEPAVRSAAPDEVWITWCDQVAIHPATIERLVELTAGASRRGRRHADGRRARPYIHLQRDGAGRIVEILHRREGDAMPDEGRERHGTLRACRRRASRTCCRATRETVALGSTTGERNFLPFIAWASARHEVVTFPVGRRDGSGRRQHAGGAAGGRSVSGGAGVARHRDADAVGRHPRLQRRAVHRHAARADPRGRSRAARPRQARSSSSTTARAIGPSRSRRRSPGVRVHRMPVNGGKGKAVRAGIGLATGDLLIIQDADLEYDPNDYVPMVQALQAGRGDVVYGSRYLGRGRHANQSLAAYLGGRSLSLVALAFTGTLSDRHGHRVQALQAHGSGRA